LQSVPAEIPGLQLPGLRRCSRAEILLERPSLNLSLMGKNSGIFTAQCSCSWHSTARLPEWKVVRQELQSPLLSSACSQRSIPAIVAGGEKSRMEKGVKVKRYEGCSVVTFEMGADVLWYLKGWFSNREKYGAMSGAALLVVHECSKHHGFVRLLPLKEAEAQA
jgi:hypothetical protein